MNCLTQMAQVCPLRRLQLQEHKALRNCSIILGFPFFTARLSACAGSSLEGYGSPLVARFYTPSCFEFTILQV
jgi:hypothetical protein